MIESITSQQAFASHVLDATVPVLVDFYTDWCGPCQAQAPILEAFADAHVGDVSVVKVNIEDNIDIARTYGVRSIPTLTLFKEGQPIETRVGLSSASELEALASS